MRGSVTVFCSSSNDIAPAFFTAATALGTQIAASGYGLVFGGTDLGLMAAVARAVQTGGGQVVGVLPEAFMKRNIAYADADELIVTRDLRERKARMEARADAFIVMPGGFGTLEEALEIITLKQLKFHCKPIVLLNTDGFYDHLVEFFDRLTHDRFARAETHELFHVASDAATALAHIDRELHSG